MTNEEAKKMLEAKKECLRRETSGIDIDCNYRNCDECDLCYEQGNMGEQQEALDMAIKILESQHCEDCISRTDLIAIMHLIMDDVKIGDNDEDYESLDDIKQQYIEIAKGMVSVKPEIKWIPVSEKLPNSYEYVLATMISPVTQLPFVSKLYTGENAKEKIEEAKVIAWMALPKPYKEKK